MNRSVIVYIYTANRVLVPVVMLLRKMIQLILHIDVNFVSTLVSTTTKR